MISRIEDLKRLIVENPSQKDFLEKQLRAVEHELTTLRKYKEVYLNLDNEEKAELEKMNKQGVEGFIAVKANSAFDALDKVNEMAKLEKNIRGIEKEIADQIAALPKDFQPINQMLHNEILHGDPKKAKIFLNETKEQLMREANEAAGTSWHAVPTGRPRRKKNG